MYIKSITFNIYLFPHSFNKYLLSTNSVINAVYNIRDAMISRLDMIPSNTELRVREERQIHRQLNRV